MNDHHFSVDDGLAWDGERTGNLSEPFSPVQPVASEDLLPTPVEMDLDATTVILDLVKPQTPLRCL